MGEPGGGGNAAGPRPKAAVPRLQGAIAALGPRPARRQTSQRLNPVRRALVPFLTRNSPKTTDRRDKEARRAQRRPRGPGRDQTQTGPRVPSWALCDALHVPLGDTSILSLQN